MILLFGSAQGSGWEPTEIMVMVVNGSLGRAGLGGSMQIQSYWALWYISQESGPIKLENCFQTSPCWHQGADEANLVTLAGRAGTQLRLVVESAGLAGAQLLGCSSGNSGSLYTMYYIPQIPNYHTHVHKYIYIYVYIYTHHIPYTLSHILIVR